LLWWHHTWLHHRCLSIPSTTHYWLAVRPLSQRPARFPSHHWHAAIVHHWWLAWHISALRDNLAITWGTHRHSHLGTRWNNLWGGRPWGDVLDSHFLIIRNDPPRKGPVIDWVFHRIFGHRFFASAVALHSLYTSCDSNLAHQLASAYPKYEWEP
jgi:hypothetical protein